MYIINIFEMERIPGYNELMTHTEDNFFPDELENYNLSHRDKVLLTLRLIRGVRYEDFILEDLTQKGRKVYHELFLQKEELPNDALVDILFRLDTVEEIIKLRASSSRFYRLTDDPKIVVQLAEKFHDKFQKDGTLIDTFAEFAEPPTTFERFLEWYGKSTLNTLKCADYHNITKCLRNAIQNQNSSKIRSLTQLFLSNREKFDSIIDSLYSEELTILDIQACINSEPNDYTKRSIFEQIFVNPMNHRYVAVDSMTPWGGGWNNPLSHLFEQLATEVDARLEQIFDHDDFAGGGMFNLFSPKAINIKNIYAWCRRKVKISLPLLGIALFYKDYHYAMKLAKSIPKTEEGKKRVKDVIRRIDSFENTSPSEVNKWLDEKWN